MRLGVGVVVVLVVAGALAEARGRSSWSARRLGAPPCSPPPCSCTRWSTGSWASPERPTSWEPSRPRRMWRSHPLSRRPVRPVPERRTAALRRHRLAWQDDQGARARRARCWLGRGEPSRAPPDRRLHRRQL